jgi:hypothetical protein
MTKLESLEAEPRGNKAATALFEHCKEVYGEMETQSREEEMGGETVIVYEGHLSKLFAQLGKATPYYTSVMTKLKTMGCVQQIRRGGGGSPSRWLLFKKPDEKDFAEAIQLAKPRHGKTAMLEQQMKDLARRVAAMEVILSGDVDEG